MADASLFTNRQRAVFQRMDASIDDFASILPSIEWDASESETHSLSSQVTMHPVEQGSDVSDHVIHKPTRLTLKLLQTNHPIYKNPYYDLGPDRVGRTFDALDELRLFAVPFEVVTSLRRYENMLIESIEVDRNAKTGQALSVSVSLTQVRLVSNATVPDPRDLRGKTGKKEGLKPTTPVAAGSPVAEKSYTVLNGLIGGAINDFGLDLDVDPG